MTRTKSLLVVTLVTICFGAVGTSVLSPTLEAQKVRQQEVVVQARSSDVYNWIFILVTANGVGVDNLGSSVPGDKFGITLPPGWSLRAIGLNEAGDPTDYNSCVVQPTYFTNDGAGAYSIAYQQGSCGDVELVLDGDIGFHLSYASQTISGGTVGKLHFNRGL